MIRVHLLNRDGEVAAYIFTHPRHTVDEADWLWPVRCFQTIFDHAKEGI